MRDGQGQFSSKAKLEKKRSGHQRTQGIREWRAKRKLEFEESDPTAKFIPVETRASKVRVHFDELLLGVLLAQFQVNHIATTATIEDCNARSRRVASQGGRNLLRQRLQLEDSEIGFISGQRGGFDDARKLKIMFTKYN